jgi:uncharacterized RDD family membrane protein YckC
MSTTTPGPAGGVGTVAVRECASCRRPVRADARFCTACGQPVQADVTVHVVEAQPRTRVEQRPREPRPAVLHPAFGDATPAGPGRRVLAYAIDAAAVGAVAGGVLGATGSVVLVALTVVELAVGLVVWEAHTGRTLGNSLLGLRTAREETPYSVGPARAALRGLVLAAGHAAAGLGQWLVVASTAFDKTGKAQAWHDKVGRAVVVDVRAHERAVEEALDAADAAAGRPVPAQASRTSGRGHASVPQQPQGGAPAQFGAGHVGAGHVGGGQPAGVAGAVASPQLAPSQSTPSQPGTPSGAGASAAAPTGSRAAREAAQPAGPGAPTVPAPTAGGPGPQGAPDGWTGVRPVVPAQARPDEPAPARVAHQAQPAPFLVTLDTGQVMSVTGPGLIGRAPRPTPGERCDHVIVVDDPERSVSRTHARFGIDGGTFWVSDAGSGNGTTLRLPDGRVVAVPADQRVAVPSGATIQVGDRGVRIDAPGAARG